MRRLLVVRHAEPEIDTSIPAAEWPLAARGVTSSRRLAGALSPYQPAEIVASPERKAIETAQLIAESLEIPLRTDDRLSEHGAGPDEFISDYAEFRQRVEDFFRQPDVVAFRRESATEAARRFAACVDAACTNDVARVVVTHGRIMSAWLGQMSDQSAWDIWTGLRLPDLVEVDLDGKTFRAISGPFV